MADHPQSRRSVRPASVTSSLRARAAVTLLLLLMSGCAAVAKGPNDAPAGCDAKRVTIVRHAFVLAERQTQAALAFLDATPDHAHVRTWFGTTAPAKIRIRLAQTLERLRPARHAPWFCGSPESCGNRPIFAIANLTRGTINLCPMFFNARNEGGDSRPGVLVHETSHLAAGTTDIVYGQAAARALALKQPERAAVNADNYEYFVEFLPDWAAPPAGR